MNGGNGFDNGAMGQGPAVPGMGPPGPFFAASSGSTSKPVDPSMTLSAAELRRAREIKAAVEASDKIDTSEPDATASSSFGIFGENVKCGRIAEYDYAQLAITSRHLEMDVVVERAYKLQCFKKEYKIQDTLEEGLYLIHQLMQRFPGFVLSVDFAPRYGSYIFVYDYAAFFPGCIKTLDDVRSFLGGLYYIYQCLSTNMRAIRSGVVFICECEGMEDENLDMRLEEKVVHELFGHYPFCFKECLWLNTPTVANIAYALLKKQVPPDFLATWRLGCKLDGYQGRIDALFKLPTMQLAQEHLLQRIEGFLMERYQENGPSFQLTDRFLAPADTLPTLAHPMQLNGNDAAAGGPADHDMNDDNDDDAHNVIDVNNI